ncbi:hypothetical protein FWD20_04040 [Candidatus Saccharibacteria bacterium]|nr:hypothetical protein [Candidatus Saccharibacteria bacterium]
MGPITFLLYIPTVIFFVLVYFHQRKLKQLKESDVIGDYSWGFVMGLSGGVLLSALYAGLGVKTGDKKFDKEYRKKFDIGIVIGILTQVLVVSIPMIMYMMQMSERS